MKLTLSWLKTYLDTDASLSQICETLTNIGLEVEAVSNQAQALSYFTVAKIIEAKPHENSNKLKICQVEVLGGAMLQIICGASNAREGLKVAYAPIGAIIPANQMLIKKAKIAGVESNGMLCSARELGLGEDSDGIIEIDDEYPIGTKITEIYGKNDAVIEINVTPNRGDCLGVYGVARDLAAAGLGELKKLHIEKIDPQFSFPFSIKNNAKNACHYAAFRVIKNVKNCESPKWLKDKLSDIGVNSISAIVDVTNYVMFCLNRPMHAYDAAKINGAIDIRFARNGEKFISLKNEEYDLSEKIMLVADESKSLAVAGVIGSNNSSCDLTTSEIILEAAYFDDVFVASAGRELNIITDSRYRFERGVDVATCKQGIEFATQLILEICGGVVSEIEFIQGEKKVERAVEFELSQIKKLIGVEVPSNKALDILHRLEFEVQKISDDKYLAKIPTHRHDVAISQDIVEEVIRIYGYDKITSQKLESSARKTNGCMLDQVRSMLAIKGMIENINWSFCDHELVELFAKTNLQLMLLNPISSDLNHMRPNLLIGLLQSYKKNYVRSLQDLSAFEIGMIFEGIDERSQRLQISGMRAGKNKEQNHYNDQRDFDIFDVKKDFFDVVELFGLKSSSLQIIDSEAPKYYHPHRSACLKLGKNIVGYFGEIHPKIAKKFDVKTTVNVFEIFVDALPQTKAVSKKSYSANDLQPVQRDFAFLVDKMQTIGNLIKTIENCDKQLIKQVDIFDIYSGKNIEEGKKSVALRATIQALDKTLTSEEIDIISQKIIDSVVKNHSAILRK